MGEADLDKAEQQILGFYHCSQGYDIGSLVSSMGLTKEEYAKLNEMKMLDYLPEELKEEIEKALEIE